MKIINKINKRVAKTTMRLFFEVENDGSVALEGELLMEVKLGILTRHNVKMKMNRLLVGNFGVFYFDIAKAHLKAGRKYSWVFHNEKFKIEGSGLLTDKFENLYEG